ncbi:phage Gp19/Gp15/Gp42 family protein [Corynebacterium accolens]|uniref:Gp19/Gp15/Gp42 family protein n=1 Tax=Corynebacterium accolens TaxID=38284 RepID=UPI00205FC0AA|nr:Gp19/Gp15/Gp42 family protein [Corynebacterium accolens]DAR74677.1 MAG TPA: head to tail adaptor [Caudoviricetes sp.]MDK8472394.1 Gp19/Gp15/Gp42 family protein [Corynebacterium accolens]MDK8618469.1 Gp19/Gp15/Gp42 family protein [Corynebacterium accolens]WKS69771.1 phage Gp19/Gp15/Gp42 family protein [Corynebacterium accolens]WKS72048.1 phage Gp19/Gp15/Gp42 family protein [Corynebacterium accolens]
MITITTNDVAGILPRTLTDDETTRMGKLIERAVELIYMEFGRRGRDLEAEIVAKPWLSTAVKQAVLVMVSKAVLIGEDIGRASVSSTTGPQSDSISYSQGIGIQWGGVGIDDEILALLGLLAGGMPMGRGGQVIPFGQRRRDHHHGAEFAEGRWYR